MQKQSEFRETEEFWKDQKEKDRKKYNYIGNTYRTSDRSQEEWREIVSFLIQLYQNELGEG